MKQSRGTTYGEPLLGGKQPRVGNRKGAISRWSLSTARIVLERFGTLIVALLLLLVFASTADRFFTYSNIMNILQQVSVVAVIAIGSTMVILIGGIDLSPGSVVLLSSVVTGALLQNGVMRVGPAIVAGLLVSVAVGLLNGVFIEKIGISPVIVTLGSQTATRGLALIILAMNHSWIWMSDPLFEFVGSGKIGFVPVAVTAMAMLFLIVSILISRTSFGRALYAIGGNQVAARLCGLNVVWIKISVYVLASLFAGLGGILLSSRLGSILPAVGTGLEFDAITAVVLGGTSLKGGVGRLGNTLLGAIIVGLVLNYLTMRGISAHYQRAFTGFIILVAALLDRTIHGTD